MRAAGTSRSRQPWLVAVFSFLLVAGALSQASDDAALAKDFQDRVNHYVELHKETGVGSKTSDSPDKVAQEKHDAREKIQGARASAKQGEIFTPRIGSYFKRQIAATMQGPEGAKIRTSLRHAEPLPHLQLKVNAPYPQKVPLQSTPPTLLMNLPHLPGKLQYRIVGSTLVLYDVASGLVVDFLPHALPPA
jgi:hypothetical protein